MPAVVRGIFVCLLLAVPVRGDTLDEALRTLARKTSLRLTAGESGRVVEHNLSSLAAGEAARARTVFENFLRRTPSGPTHPVDITLTISQNVRGFLLLAELQRHGDRVVDMVAYRPGLVAHSTRVVLERHPIWEQATQMLDVAVLDDRMLVLEPASIVLYARRGTSWQWLDSRPLEGAPVGRDLRGRLQIVEGAVTAYLAGATCRGAWTPALEVRCEPGSTEFPWSGTAVKLVAGRNTLETEGGPPVFSFARVEDDGRALYLTAGLDGRTSLYDADRNLSGAWEGWGSDFVAAESGCGARHEVLAASSGEPDANDSITAYEVADRKAVQSSDQVELPGPVTALWPAEGGAVAVARNLNSNQYAAYSVTIHCNF